jgi:hypothetical protein
MLVQDQSKQNTFIQFLKLLPDKAHRLRQRIDTQSKSVKDFCQQASISLMYTTVLPGIIL